MTANTRSPAAAPVRAQFKRRGHIVLNLLAALVFVAIVPLAMMSWKLFQINQEALMTDRQRVQMLQAESTARELGTRVEGLRSQLLLAAQTLGVAFRRPGGSSRDELRQVLADVAQPPVAYLRYSYFEGRGVRSVAAGEVPQELEPRFEGILQQVAEVQSERKGESWTMPSEPFLLEQNGRASIVIAAPVLSRGSFRGVVSALIDLQSVWDVTTSSQHTGNVVFALDEAGRVFASSDQERVAPGEDLSRFPLVLHSRRSGGRARMTILFDVAEPDGGERRYMGSFEPTRQGWDIFVQAPEDEVLASIGLMKQQTFKWAGIALGLAGLVAIYFARGLSGPINKLAAASRAFTRGDFTKRVETRSRHEIGELAHTFNGMASEIERRIEQLKRALDERNELFRGTIRALAEAIDAKDPYTRGHSVRVNQYALILAEELGLPEKEIKDIDVSSLLHDVGKIGIHDAILQKPGALTDEEFEIMKTHTTKGASIMAPIRQMKRIIPGLRWHHERADGRGYPDGLTNNKIPLMARIIAVADTFDAITTKRPYQDPMSFERAVARVNELRSIALDDQVVGAFNRACESGRIRLDDRADTPSVTPERPVVAAVAACGGPKVDPPESRPGSFSS